MERRTLILTAAEALECLDPGEVLRVVEETFRESARSGAILPPKMIMNIPAGGHTDFVMIGPASVPALKATGVKIATGYEENVSRHGLPHILSVMILTDHETGSALAIFDGTHLTSFRTGAMVAVAAKYLALPDSGEVAFVGAGTQARASARALARVFSLRQIRLFDIHPRAAEGFEKEIGPALGIPVRACPTAREAVERADIIVTATSGEGEWVREPWVRKGAFVASVGSYPELDPALPLKVEKVVVDDRAQARYRGELRKAYEKGAFGDERVHAELGEVVCGKKAGRRTPEERILACLIGVGTLDVAVARRVYEIARERGRGTFFDLQTLTKS